MKIDKFQKEESYYGDPIYTMEIDDNYYDIVVIKDVDTNPNVIFWSDRDNEGIFQKIKWYLILDTHFYFDENSELDSQVLNKIRDIK